MNLNKKNIINETPISVIDKIKDEKSRSYSVFNNNSENSDNSDNIKEELFSSDTSDESGYEEDDIYGYNVKNPKIEGIKLSFKLNDEFVNQYKDKIPPFGFNGLGEIVYYRTYSRLKEDGNYEEWYETVRRVVEGTYTLQKDHIDKNYSGWNEEQGQISAQEMYDKIYNMKFLPPGRGLWAMGTSLVHNKSIAAALNNCAFVSTEDLDKDPFGPFSFIMDSSMLGVGVGFDTKGANKIEIVGPNPVYPSETYVIPDSRIGWVTSLEKLLNVYFQNPDNIWDNNDIIFDYSKIRPAGKRLKTFGGIASGPEPLISLHNSIRKVLNKRIGKKLDSCGIVDICNLIGKCVVSGNINRSAEIAFGEADDIEFLDLKNYEKNPERMEYGWTSNNSIFANIGMDYREVAKRICINGEPGICWLNNMREYSRMNGKKDNKDSRVQGGNPCLEQSLESYEMCCLVETFPTRHESKKEFLRTLKFAYLYAKTVSLFLTHWPQTNRVMLRNRRIGCSISGIAQFLSNHSIDTLKEWLNDGYDTISHWDDVYSDWFCIPRSIKTTSVKPSGTISILPGVTSGVHFPISRYFIRRVRIAKLSPLIQSIKEAGYNIEECKDNNNLMVVEIPVDVGENVRTLEEVPMYEQISLAAFMQKYWADNQVSCTVTFNPETEGKHIASTLDYYQYELKGISFLPNSKQEVYEQMPYEKITKEKYEELLSKIKTTTFKPKQNYKNKVENKEIFINDKQGSEIKDEGVDIHMFPFAISYCTNESFE